jgi:hypothetical protein
VDPRDTIVLSRKSEWEIGPLRIPISETSRQERGPEVELDVQVFVKGSEGSFVWRLKAENTWTSFERKMREKWRAKSWCPETVGTKRNRPS